MSDYIDRQAAIDAFLTELTKRERKNLLHTWSTVEVKYFVVDMLEKLPAAQPTIIEAEAEPVKRGKWIYDNQFHWYRASCSECGYKRVTDIKAEKWNGWKYCPNCGAKMDAEEGEEV